MRPEPFIAAIRFGHGRRPWEPLPADPRAALVAELNAAAAPQEYPLEIVLNKYTLEHKDGKDLRKLKVPEITEITP